MQLPHPLESGTETGLRETGCWQWCRFNAAFMTLGQAQGCVAGVRLSVLRTEAALPRPPPSFPQSTLTAPGSTGVGRLLSVLS